MGVFSEMKPVNHARKNPFDLGCYSTYNTKAGIILPLKFWPTLPNSEYELDLKALLRTQPLSTAAFAGFSINYDVVWTPYNDHYSSFNQFIAQRLNKQHVTQPDINQIPHFNLGSFVYTLLGYAVYDYFGAMTSFDELQDFFMDQHFELDINRYLAYSRHLPEESMALSALRTLDLLGYGNYLPLVKGICAAIKDIIDHSTYEVAGQDKLPYVARYLATIAAGSYDWTSHKFSDLGGFSVNASAFSIATMFKDTYIDHSGRLTKYGIKLAGLLPTSSYYSLWPVMTYNKAFWEFYRNEYYDIEYEWYDQDNTGNMHIQSTPYVNIFNMDDISSAIDCGQFIVANQSVFDRLLCMFAIKPHQYKKDRFTGLLPSTQYGSVSVASADDVFYTLVGNMHTPASRNLSRGDVYSDGNNTVKTSATVGSVSGVTSESYKFDPTPMINVLELRKADALQRFRERMLRAGNKTKDIFKAHGWEEPKSESAFDVQFFGSFDGRLDLNVVASTTDTENVNLGQLASNGIGVISGKKVRFQSHDFGTLLVVAYITKDAIYDAYGIDKSHMLLEPFDFPYPELQNVSLSPITKQELTIYGNSSSWNNNTVGLGFLPQNMAYKTQNDETHGEFFTTNPFYGYSALDDRVVPIGIFANMVTPRLDISDPKSLSFFYIQPSCADNIFVKNADGNQDSDQFFCNIRFDLKAVQPLDVIGLPI